jgi:hypothetical protein
VSESLDELLAELATDAADAIKHDRLAEEARQRVRAKLPRARKLGAGPSQLERTIQQLYVARTIGQMTKPGGAPGGPKQGRKRPGAAPDKPATRS